MSDLTSFDNFVNSAMGGRFQKMIYINIMKETTATKSQYLFENLNILQPWIINKIDNFIGKSSNLWEILKTLFHRKRKLPLH